MKTISITIIAMIICLSGYSQGQSTGQENKPVKLAVELKTHDDSLQYALGAFLGKWMVENDFDVYNAKLFLSGMDDMLKERSLAVSESMVVPLISSHQISKQNLKYQQLEEQLFASLKGRPGVGVLPNGVHYIVIEQGTGVRPGLDDTIIFNTKGILADGEVFEDTHKSNQPITIVARDLMNGLSEAIQLMPEGSSWRIFVPSVQAYGPAGRPGVIPPYAALVFDVKLEQVIRSK